MSCPMARILLKRGSRHDARVGGPTVPSHAKPYLSVQMRTLVHAGRPPPATALCCFPPAALMFRGSPVDEKGYGPQWTFSCTFLPEAAYALHARYPPAPVR